LNKEKIFMWVHEESISTTATASQIWRLFSDVRSWPRWNAGVTRIELTGSFEAGASFAMHTPDGEIFHSTLTDVQENAGFTDETKVDGTKVTVHHRILPGVRGQLKILYRTEISGPQANEFGPFVTADFPQVLAALKQLAET
jgi:hypothetical protein